MAQFARDQRSVVIGTSDTQLLGPNARRVGLILSAPPTNRITIQFGDSPAVLDQGITLYPAGPPLVLMDGASAQWAREGVRAISAVAAQNVNVVDVFTT